VTNSIKTDRWSDLKRGSWQGCSIAQVALRDPDYFFWAHERGVLAHWCVPRYEEVCTKASRIRLPLAEGVQQVVDYTFTAGFGVLSNVKVRRASDPMQAGVERRPSLDLSAGRRPCGRRNKAGAAMLVRVLEQTVFEPRGWQRLTRRRCEAFFDDDDAFDLTPEERAYFHHKQWHAGFISVRHRIT
jgi:hypothetical protein